MDIYGAAPELFADHSVRICTTACKRASVHVCILDVRYLSICWVLWNSPCFFFFFGGGCFFFRRRAFSLLEQTNGHMQSFNYELFSEPNINNISIRQLTPFTACYLNGISTNPYVHGEGFGIVASFIETVHQLRVAWCYTVVRYAYEYGEQA